MAGLTRLRSLWRNLAQRDRVDRDLDDEVRGMFDLLVDEKRRNGLSPAEARRTAALELGRIDVLTEQVRDGRSGALVDNLLQDARYGARILRRNPIFTLTAILSLAIGIGANTTMFSLINALLLREVAVSSPEELVELGRITQFGAGTAFSYPAYERFRDENSAFAGVLALSKNTMAATTVSTRPAAARFVSANFFDVLGVRPLAGRLLSPRDDRPDAPERSAVAVISHRFWLREFGGNAAALGQVLRIEPVAFTIVGIAPPRFDDIMVGRPADLFIPMASEPLVRRNTLLPNAASSWLGVVGRLKPGVTNEAAQANLAPIFARFMDRLATENRDAEAQQRMRAQRLFLQSASNGVSEIRRDFARPLLLLMAAVTLVLAIACANIANLLLARGVARRREIGLRLAIGASRARVIRQLLTEAALLGLAGAALGLLASTWGAPLVAALVTQGGLPIDLDLSPDLRVLFFTTTIALGASLVAGVLPALRSARADLTPSFQAARSEPATPDSTRWGHVLIAGQVALSLLLLIGAMLLVATLRNIRGFDPGFDSGRAILLTLDPGRAGYDGARLTGYYRAVLDRVRQLPGVQAASLSKVTPISGGGIDLPITIEGRPREPGLMVYANRLSDGFFATMAIPMRLGRDFVPSDGERANAVVVVNEALARRFFKDENPLGRRFMLSGPDLLEIIGVVANSKYLTLRDADRPTAYLYAPDIPEPGGMTLSIRTAGDPLALASGIREQVQAIAPAVPVSQVRTLASQVERSLVTERLVARLLGAFAALALILASVGLYGVLGYSVARRTGEIGLRLALGATRAGVLRSVLRQSLAAVAIGSAIGMAATAILSRPLAGLLYGVGPSDPKVVAGAVGCLLLVAAISAAGPAWRAARVDPLVALRHD